MTKVPLRRCAIYTRKSTEEGLEQEFNTLHAQREACAAFITSQRGEGWKVIGTIYDDGGFSGGNMDRPALKRLLADVAERSIDTVVVYKVDRLTRSLSDFAKIVDKFDARGVSFVSVTQQFNTTSSMGRLTLNILLSFAQFEREIAGERIRDKIAASKRKGMWMGGTVPLGYDIRDKKLVINPKEAKTVHLLYRRYLDLDSVRALEEEVNREGIRPRIRIGKAGKPLSGIRFSRGALYSILSNPIYIGETRHKKINYPGQHEALMERDLWDQVQEHLRDHGTRRRERPRKTETSLLTGKLFDEHGLRLTPSHAVKKGRRYRYYISQALTTGLKNEKEGVWRLPASEIEGLVIRELTAFLADDKAVADALRQAGLAAKSLSMGLEGAKSLHAQVTSTVERDVATNLLLSRIDLLSDCIGVSISIGALMPDGHLSAPPLVRMVPMTVRRRGVEQRLVIESAAPLPARLDPVLLKTVARAYRWFSMLIAGDASMTEVAQSDGLTHRSISNLLPLAFLAPDIVEAIAKGHQPSDLTTKRLVTRLELPTAWIAQKDTLGIA